MPVDPFLEAYERGYRDALAHVGQPKLDLAPQPSTGPCPACKGTGAANVTSFEEQPHDCPRCDGTGAAPLPRFIAPAAIPPLVFTLEWMEPCEGRLKHPSHTVPHLDFSTDDADTTLEWAQAANAKRILDALNQAIAGRTLVLE